MAIDVVYALASFLPESLVACMDPLLPLLKTAKADKSKPVREAAQEALSRIKEARLRDGRALHESPPKNVAKGAPVPEEDKRTAKVPAEHTSILYKPINPNFIKAAPKTAVEILTPSPAKYVEQPAPAPAPDPEPETELGFGHKDEKKVEGPELPPDASSYPHSRPAMTPFQPEPEPEPEPEPGLASYPNLDPDGDREAEADHQPEDEGEYGYPHESRAEDEDGRKDEIPKAQDLIADDVSPSDQPPASATEAGTSTAPGLGRGRELESTEPAIEETKDLNKDLGQIEDRILKGREEKEKEGRERNRDRDRDRGRWTGEGAKEGGSEAVGRLSERQDRKPQSPGRGEALSSSSLAVLQQTLEGVGKVECIERRYSNKCV